LLLSEKDEKTVFRHSRENGNPGILEYLDREKIAEKKKGGFVGPPLAWNFGRGAQCALNVLHGES
jgi:hypothetical protein